MLNIFRKNKEKIKETDGIVSEKLTPLGVCTPPQETDYFPRQLADPEFKNNFLLSKNVAIGKNILKRNNHICVIGSDDTDIVNSYIIPNILMANNNYIITDIEGKIYEKTKDHLEKHGYDVRVFDVNNKDDVFAYNPFNYVKSVEDIKIIVDCIIKTSSLYEQKTEDLFWRKIEEHLFLSIFTYIWLYKPKKEQHMGTVMDLLSAAEPDRFASTYKSELAEMFAAIASTENALKVLKHYDIIKGFNPPVFKSILVGCFVKLSVYNYYNKPGNSFDLNFMNKKSALFIICNSSPSENDFLIPLIYSQLFNIISTPTKFFISKMNNKNFLPVLNFNWVKLRKNNLSCDFIINNTEQMQNTYKDTWDTLLSYPDSLLLLDKTDEKTLENIAEKVLYLKDEEKMQFYKAANDLTDDQCIVKIRGCRTITDEKIF